MCSAGKTAPKLVSDFLRFDPLYVDTPNLLTDPPRPADAGRAPAPGARSCKHEYSIKAAQSVLPPVDSRPQVGTRYKIAVVCRRCRIHADVNISYPRATTPCPSADNPIHHLQARVDPKETTQQSITYRWMCSVEVCRAEVKISFRLPRLAPELRDLFTAERLQKRYDEVVQADPDRNPKLVTPISAMHTLQRYLKDALDPAVEKRRLMANNKVFITTFGKLGRDCSALLTRMGFVFHPADGDNEAQWSLPNPPQIINRLDADSTSHREMLEDIEMEAIALMSKLSQESGEMNPLAARGWQVADREIERVLSAQNCLLHSVLASGSSVANTFM
jgi:ubiquitin carboxyl-terminal hydrolase 25/28